MLFLKNIRLRLTDSTKYVKLFSENLCGKQMKQKAETFLRILGIDPGLATMGWGVIEADGYREKLVQYGALITLSARHLSHASAVHLHRRAGTLADLQAGRNCV